jgi:hypothetical protein
LTSSQQQQQQQQQSFGLAYERHVVTGM